jgi:GNAT superfamily N-acetyltransferase
MTPQRPPGTIRGPRRRGPRRAGGSVGAITYREGGAIPDRQLAELAAALGVPAAAIPRPAQLLAAAAVVSAWDGARLVGLARLVGDLETLAVLQPVGVHPAYRQHGIGHALVGRALARCEATPVLVLLARPEEAAFYAPFGFTEPVQALLRPVPAAPGA